MLKRKYDLSRRKAGGLAAAVAGLTIAVATMAGAIPKLGAQEAEKSAVFLQPTYSSPIALSRNNLLLWSVNPGDDSVSVVRTDTDQRIRNIKVGDEPQSVALDPNNKFAFVANAAGSSVTVIQIVNPNPGAFQAQVEKTIKTGAEPWNIVISPNGKRVFVANSGQDTITVINALTRNVIGDIRLRGSLCNDQFRHFQPRGLAVSVDNKQLFVTRFLSFTKPGGRGADDKGEEGVVCRLSINTNALAIAGYHPVEKITLAAQPTEFSIAGVTGTESTAFPNQLQSIVLRGDRAYLPNIAASPESPLQFQNSTQAYLNVISGVGGTGLKDEGALNLHLGARNPEPPKKTLFFANPWGIAFTTGAGAPGNAYVISAGSDLLVKLNVDAAGALSFTVDGDTTRYIDLNDPLNPATSGRFAGKNPQGIVIKNGVVAYVANFVSRNISKVDLTSDTVVKVIPTTLLPPPGSRDEQVLVGAEMFFSTRGHFSGPTGITSTDERLSQSGWQGCASCHFKGLTDGVVWVFGPGPRKSIPLAINPKHPKVERVLNYSAQRDERQDFELNIRNVSGPGPLTTGAVPCSASPPDTSTFDPKHGLLVGDADFSLAPCVINDLFLKPNTGRSQVTVTLAGSNTAWPALDALDQWMRFAVRAPNGPLTDQELPGGVSSATIAEGRDLFREARCTACHRGFLWSRSVLDFKPPPNPGVGVAPGTGTEIFCERNLGNPLLLGCLDPQDFGDPNGGQFLARFLRDVGSYNRGVAGTGNDFGSNIGGVEKAAAVIANGALVVPQQDALGIDFNGDGRGNGFAVSSLLGIFASPPYGHNGSCETIACVVSDNRHRTANGKLPDVLNTPLERFKVTRFVESIDLQSQPFLP